MPGKFYSWSLFLHIAWMMIFNSMPTICSNAALFICHTFIFLHQQWEWYGFLEEEKTMMHVVMHPRAQSVWYTVYVAENGRKIPPSVKGAILEVCETLQMERKGFILHIWGNYFLKGNFNSPNTYLELQYEIIKGLYKSV